MNHRSSIPWTGALALAVCLVLLRPDPASAETYQWTDKDGTVGFADSLEKVPPQYRQSAKRLEETKESTKSFQRVPTPPDRSNTMPSAPTDQGDPYAVWRQRMAAARAELEELRAKRQKAQEEYDNLLFLRRNQQLRSYRVDPDTEAEAASKISALDQRIRDKEYDINTAIPDQARRAGVPPGALSQ
jgi:hypothetical protein